MTAPAAGPRDCVDLRPAVENDLAAITRLLQQAELPTAGVEESLDHFLVAEHEGDMVAAAGLEVHAPAALLRSVAVRPDWRGKGLARQLVDRLLAKATAAGIQDIYLLTTTAEHYFPRLGFVCVRRDEVPGGVQASIEFREACPASAVVMHRRVDVGLKGTQGRGDA